MYSTCSIHAEEDERVVARALKSGGGRWRVAPRSAVLPSWERRGLAEELGPDAEGVIRCLPEDKTNGFFVSCFLRVEGDEIKKGGAKTKAPEGLKRPREEDDDDEADGEEVEGEADVEKVQEVKEAKEAKPKTAAQLERARRKKKQQQQKKQRT